jgi:hypothetical protein
LRLAPSPPRVSFAWFPVSPQDCSGKYRQGARALEQAETILSRVAAKDEEWLFATHDAPELVGPQKAMKRVLSAYKDLLALRDWEHCRAKYGPTNVLASLHKVMTELTTKARSAASPRWTSKARPRRGRRRERGQRPRGQGRRRVVSARGAVVVLAVVRRRPPQTDELEAEVGKLLRMQAARRRPAPKKLRREASENDK